MATATIILYKSKTLKDGTHPIMMQVIHNGNTKRKRIGFSSLLKDWNNEHRVVERSHPNAERINKRISIIKSELQRTMDWFDFQGIPFSTDRFFARIEGNYKPLKLLTLFDNKIKSLKKQKREGTAQTYQDTKNALKRYIGKRNVLLQDVDLKFLNGFEEFLRTDGCNGGIRVYMECIRALYNESIGHGYVPGEFYPFARFKADKFKYHISRLRPDVKPRGLSAEDRVKWKRFDPDAYPKLALTYTIQNFMYYARGMNFTDMSKLKWSDVYNGRISYLRQKTKRFIDLPISENIANILTGLPKTSDNDYIFPILDEAIHKSHTQQRNRIKKCIKKHNKDLKTIASIQGIKLNITSYVARHSYAMALLEGGEPDSVIGHNLGHAPGNSKVLKHYLGKLNSSVYDKADRHL